MILNSDTAEKKLKRMAMEIAERNFQEKSLVVIGIRESGWVIAQKIAAMLKPAFAGDIEVTGLKIDKKNPGSIEIDSPMDLSGKTIVLIDDVANSGRTMLYALKPLLEFYPKSIQTLALVERSYKQFPVSVDYVGISVATTQQQHIEVRVENGEIIGAIIIN